MSEYKEPDRTAFDSAMQSALDIMSTAFPDIITKPGSAVRELVLRPIAYLYAWLVTAVSNIYDTYTIAYLSQSGATENPVADAVASNYFVIRRDGVRSQGVVTVIINTSAIQFGPDFIFTVGGVSVGVPKRIIASGSQYRDTDAALYVPVSPYGDGTWCTAVPVLAITAGAIEIPAGTPVTGHTAHISIVEATLTSALTGGCNIETDAQLMARARYNTADAGVGSYYGMQKKLDRCPVKVYGFSLVSGEDDAAYRARYNSVNVNPGGYIDCYVKTQAQAANTTVALTGTYTIGASCTLELTNAPAGPMTVTGLRVEGVPVTRFNIIYDVYGTGESADGARLSNRQRTLVEFTPPAATPGTFNALVSVSYMPGINDIQQFVDQDVNRFVGQDIRIKAAIPVIVSMDCAFSYDDTVTEELTDAIKGAIINYVNNTQVGSRTLNFSDIRAYVAATVPGVELRLPCAMSATLLRRTAGTVSYYSTSGILNIGVQQYNDCWYPGICFFSMPDNGVRITEI